MLVGHIQGSWGTEVPAHQTSHSPPLLRGGRGGAVLLRVVVALPFNFCSVRILKGSLRLHPIPDLSFSFFPVGWWRRLLLVCCAWRTYVSLAAGALVPSQVGQQKQKKSPCALRICPNLYPSTLSLQSPRYEWYTWPNRHQTLHVARQNQMLMVMGSSFAKVTHFTSKRGAN